MIGEQRRLVRRGLTLVVAMGLLLAACSSAEGGSGGSEGTASNGTGSSLADEFTRDGTIRVGYDLVQPAGSGFSLDPTKQPNETNDGLLYSIYGRLMRANADGSAVPDQAKSVTVVDDSTIDIEVREGQTFQDGSPFDAAAVKAGLELNANAGEAPIAAAFEGVDSIEVTGANSLRIAIADGKARSWSDTYLAGWQTTIVKPDEDFQNPVGAGPMRVASYRDGQELVLERYDGYWDAANVNFAGIDLVSIASASPQSSTAALLAHQVDLVSSDVDQVPSLPSGFDVVSYTDPTRLANMQVCKREEPLSDPLVRQALNKAIDRDAVGEAVFGGASEPATEPWPPGHQFWNPDVADVLAYDPDAARSLLQQAGHPDGIDVDVYVLPAQNSAEVAQVVQQQWAEVGIRANLINTPNYVAGFLEPKKPGVGVIPSISKGRERLLHWGAGEALGNACSYVQPEITSLSEQLATYSDSDSEAVDIWHQIDEIVTEEALSVFIAWTPLLGAYDAAKLDQPSIWPVGTHIFPSPFGDGMLSE
jgi:peptide/nickel transport system substrate-binding protein